MHVLMREGRKKEASKVKQTTRQSNTAHPRQSLFLRKMSCLGWDLNPRHSRQSTLPLSYQGSMDSLNMELFFLVARFNTVTETLLLS